MEASTQTMYELRKVPARMSLSNLMKILTAESGELSSPRLKGKLLSLLWFGTPNSYRLQKALTTGGFLQRCGYETRVRRW